MAFTKSAPKVHKFIEYTIAFDEILHFLPKILQIHYPKPPILVDKMVKQLCNTQKVRHTEHYYHHTRISNIQTLAVHVYFR